MAVLPVAFSLMASFMSAITLLGVSQVLGSMLLRASAQKQSQLHVLLHSITGSKNLADSESIGEQIFEGGYFSVFLGKEASFPRITGKFPLQGTYSPILYEIYHVFGTVHSMPVPVFYSFRLCFFAEIFATLRNMYGAIILYIDRFLYIFVPLQPLRS
jgi:hypothetical protein